MKDMNKSNLPKKIKYLSELSSDKLNIATRTLSRNSCFVVVFDDTALTILVVKLLTLSCCVDKMTETNA